MPLDITGNIENNYYNAHDELVEITHVEVTYYTPKDDYKHFQILPIEKANEFANKKGINGAYVSTLYLKEEAINNGWIKE
ncbi:hypothetical protein CN514_00795 [Bacillus sp. AFS001701]|uniref:hypothetical protein n=1 Tax=Bacillus sp. AFS001701 TaxID=2033480 RepID=UPI000BF9C941|nr:hypothetical protein [Bacillus sp. AFS001701]PET77568.1 hypothetical protein CN514_00795 [Bacillus sp. AFS001701]